MFGRKPGLGPRVQDLDRRQQDAERLLKSLPGPTTPLTAPPKLPQPLVQYATLQVRPRDRPHMGRGQDGSLLLSCMNLSFTTSRRFIPTLSGLERPLHQDM